MLFFVKTSNDIRRLVNSEVKHIIHNVVRIWHLMFVDSVSREKEEFLVIRTARKRIRLSASQTSKETFSPSDARQQKKTLVYFVFRNYFFNLRISLMKYFLIIVILTLTYTSIFSTSYCQSWNSLVWRNLLSINFIIRRSTYEVP